MKSVLVFSCLLLLCLTGSAQVKIGQPAGAPDPAAILELSDTARGLLLPRLTQTQMNAIAAPPNGLLIFNTTNNGLYQYNQPATQWKPIVADSSEWYFDPSSAKLYLRRSFNNLDSFYYNTNTKKFVFADSRYYYTSSGGVFNLDEGNSDRFIFKTTASKYLRPYPNLNSANVYTIYNVDNDTLAASHPFEASYYGLASDVAVTPQATQKIAELYGMRAVAASGARDSVQVTYGISSNVSIRGKGYHETLLGINSSVSIRDSATTIGQITGIQNFISYSSPLGTPRVGSVFGYFGSMSAALNGKVDGNAYGIFLGNVNAAGIGSTRNWGIYTGKGPSRFGDSLLVTEGVAQRPRAVFDVNSPTAMIMPVGTTAQRPLTLYTGMLRYNTDLATPEAYTGTGWVSLKTPVLNTTTLIDPPAIANGTTGAINVTLTGVAIGNTVTVSPAAALPNGIVIAWAYASAANQVTIGFANFSGTTFDLGPLNYYIKVIQ